MAFNSRYRNPPNAFQQLKRAGSVVTGLSGVALLWTVTGLVVDQEKLGGNLPYSGVWSCGGSLLGSNCAISPGRASRCLFSIVFSVFARFRRSFS